MTKKLIVGIAVGVLALFAACESDETSDPTTVDVSREEVEAVSDADLQIVAINIAWSESGDDVCEAVSGMEGATDEEMALLMAYGISEFEKGFGEELEPEAEEHLRGLVNDCV